MGDLWLDRDGLQVLTIKAGKRNGSPPHLFYSPSFLQRLREAELSGSGDLSSGTHTDRREVMRLRIGETA